MSGLEKAKLYKLKDGADAQRDGDPIPVQFNPASLKLTMSAQADAGQSKGRAATQYAGNSATELAFDLVFDTADEAGPDGGARSVREKTALVEQFVLPQDPNGGNRQSPPRVEFEWGGLVLQGTISSLSIDFDLFAEDGKPLRAKMSVTIKEQDPKYRLLESGPGSSREGNAPAPGQATSAAPGSAGGGASGPTDRTGIALAGESAADFAVRMGLDAGAWRGLSLGLEGTLSLEAGLEIDFDASLSLSAGIGVTAGFQADLGISLEASLGLSASAGVSAGVSAGASASAGFALGAAGGVQAASQTVRIAAAEAAASASARAFGASAASTSAALPTGGGSPAASGRAAAYVPAAASASVASGAASAYIGSASASPAVTMGATTVTTPSVSPADATSAVPTAYAPPFADPRATSYGFGVPLRARSAGAAQASAGVVALRPYSVSRETPVARDPTTPPWVQLPPASAPKSGQKVPGAGQGGSSGRGGGQPGHRTGCGCGCGPKGGAR